MWSSATIRTAPPRPVRHRDADELRQARARRARRRGGAQKHVTYINGEAIDPDKEDPLQTRYPDYGPYTLGEDEYFVVGDNIDNSHDSRDWQDDLNSSDDVGPITGDMIVGHVRFVFWPLDEIRAVD